MGCSFDASYFILIILIVFFMLLYAYLGATHPKIREPFNDAKHKLIDGERMVVFQGIGLPDSRPELTLPDADPSSPSIDGTLDGPKSKFAFAYNECKPECCATSGGYACNGGCPCLTNEQLGFSMSRGNNARPRLCGENI